MSRTTYAVREDRKLRLERLAIDASNKINKQIKWTNLLEVLIDEYAKDAQQTIIHREQEKTKP